jgi:hypothetical protein
LPVPLQLQAIGWRRPLLLFAFQLRKSFVRLCKGMCTDWNIKLGNHGTLQAICAEPRLYRTSLSHAGSIGYTPNFITFNGGIPEALPERVRLVLQLQTFH